MKKAHILFLLPVLLFFAACNPCKRLARRCPPEIITKDSIIERETVEYRDTTLFVHIPGQHIIDSIPIPCPDPVPGTTTPGIFPNKLTVYGHLATASGWVQQSKLYLELTEKDTLLPVKLENAIRDRDRWREAYHNKDTTIHITPSWWQRMFFWLGVVAAFMFLLFFVIKQFFVQK